jgi:hypothetical protein
MNIFVEQEDLRSDLGRELVDIRIVILVDFACQCASFLCQVREGFRNLLVKFLQLGATIAYVPQTWVRRAFVWSVAQCFEDRIQVIDAM